MRMKTFPTIRKAVSLLTGWSPQVTSDIICERRPLTPYRKQQLERGLSIKLPDDVDGPRAMELAQATVVDLFQKINRLGIKPER